MIRALISNFLDREASRRLTRRKKRIEREAMIATTNRLLAEMGLPPDSRLRA